MRTAMLIALTVVLSGCGVELLTTTAIQGELQAEQMSAMKRQIQGVADTSGRINIERAIQTYQAEKGYYPSTLAELAPDYLPHVPTKPDGTSYGYDPSTGKLADGPAAGGPTSADRALMAKIEAAIHEYGMATGYYPASLSALAPDYLPTHPRTAAGEEFFYNNQNGQVTHPRAGQARPAGTSRPVGVGGAGPMGEVMTGIGMQQELGNMNQSGSNATGGYARRNLNSATTNTNDRTNAAMDQLGL